MSKLSQWIPVALVAALAWTGALKAEGETFTYEGDPDRPFPDAWGDPDVDCSDPHDPGESDCWKCDSDSPPKPVPKFEWILTRECPTFSMSNTVQSNCYCVLEGGEMTDSITAGYTAEDGRKYYEPSIEGCGGEPPEEEAITQTIEWNWTTAGLTTDPASGRGETASFKYTVPKGPFSIDVFFSAKATPSDTDCAEITAGPEVVGKITGEGYTSRDIPSECSSHLTRTEVPYPLRHNDHDTWGQLIPHIWGDLHCESICVDAGCKQYRVGGQFYFEADMLILSCLPVMADNCSFAKGECNPLAQFEKDDAIMHEQKHYDMYCEFIDAWNEDIAEDDTIFNTCDAINAYIHGVLYTAFQYALDRFYERHRDHCPDFANEILYGFGQCGERIPTGRRICP